MVQFIGVNFHGERARASVVDRKATLLESRSAAIAGMRSTPEGGVLEVPPGEWVRAGSLALQDLYLELPPKHRKLWGIALAGPQGWIALNPELEPVSPLRLTPGVSPLDDLLAWIAEHPTLAHQVFALLSPKDYFRLRLSGGLATDVTQARQTGLALEDRDFWSTEAVLDAGLMPDWLPPIFGSAVTTGRLSEEGIELSGIPGGVWIVSGADSTAAFELAAGLPEPGRVFAVVDRSTVLLRCVAPGAHDGAAAPAAPWQETTTALPARPAWMRVVELDGASRSVGDANAVSALREALVGLPDMGLSAPRELVVDSRTAIDADLERLGEALGVTARAAPFLGRDDPGAALLAACAKPIFRDPADLYRRLGAAIEAGKPAANADAASARNP